MATSINTAEIPVSIVASATAASYTVPSDRYAIVRAQVKGGGTLSIGGVVVLGSDTWTVINANANVRRVNQSGTIGGMSVPVGWGTANTSVGLLSTGTGGAANSGVTTVSDGGDVFANSTDRTSDVCDYKVPAGTVVAGAGDSRYLIELYRIPGSPT